MLRLVTDNFGECMKKHVYCATGAMAILTLLQKSNVFSDLLLFLLTGALPGLNYSVPADTMLVLLMVALWLMTVRFILLPLLQLAHLEQLAKRYLARKNQFPKRRYQQI